MPAVKSRMSAKTALDPSWNFPEAAVVRLPSYDELKGRTAAGINANTGAMKKYP